MAILHFNPNGFYAFLHWLTSWRRYSTASLCLAHCHVNAACVWGYVFFRFGHLACRCVNSGTTIFIWDRICYTLSYYGNCCVQLLETELCFEMSTSVEQYNYLKWIMFSDQTMFFLSCEVKRQNVQILGIKPLRDIVEYHCDNPKVMVICAMSSQMVHGPFFM